MVCAASSQQCDSSGSYVHGVRAQQELETAGRSGAHLVTLGRGTAHLAAPPLTALAQHLPAAPAPRVSTSATTLAGLSQVSLIAWSIACRCSRYITD